MSYLVSEQTKYEIFQSLIEHLKGQAKDFLEEVEENYIRESISWLSKLQIHLVTESNGVFFFLFPTIQYHEETEEGVFCNLGKDIDRLTEGKTEYIGYVGEYLLNYCQELYPGLEIETKYVDLTK